MPTRRIPQEGWQRPSGVRPRIVADLLIAIIAIDRELAKSAIATMLAWPAIYGIDTVLIPALRLLMPRHDPSLAPLLTAGRSHLRARICEALAPPTDWRRASALKCTCGDCHQLAAFLDAPGQRVWSLRAPEQVRAHVEDTLRRARADVDAVTERRGRPYRLICTKNQASYERRAAQRAQDLADFKLLDF
jgi:hypothetical protein